MPYILIHPFQKSTKVKHSLSSGKFKLRYISTGSTFQPLSINTCQKRHHFVYIEAAKQKGLEKGVVNGNIFFDCGYLRLIKSTTPC